MRVTTRTFPGFLALLLTAFLVIGCGAGSSSSGSQQPPPPATISVTVSPQTTSLRYDEVAASATTIYTLYASNAFGQTTASTTITTH